MLDTQNQGPQCVACGSPMKLTAIEPGNPGHDLRTFSCTQCTRIQRHVIESTVTEAWLEPKRGNHRNATTHDMTDGRLVPRSAK